MNYQYLLDGLKRFGSDKKDICMYGVGIPPEQVHENVIIAPCWEPDTFWDSDVIEPLAVASILPIKVWNITADAKKSITYIKTGIGAPLVLDVVLSLGVTNCKQILFIGDVGSLDKDVNIGDIVIPQWSVCGDGASRYIATTTLQTTDVFGEKAFPDANLYEKVLQNANEICTKDEVKLHIGNNYSTDTIFAQFAHIDEMINFGCTVIEMETAAAFRAAKIADIPLAAVFCVSDSTVAKKSLISGRTEEEKAYHRFTKETVIPNILLSSF